MRNINKPVWGVYLLGVLFLVSVASLLIGSRTIPFLVAWEALRIPDPTNDAHLIIRSLRVPRTGLAILAGAALGLAGALMQALTRNALAEPGLLGINAGAAFGVVMGLLFLPNLTVWNYVWFSFLGAGVSGVLVALLGRAHSARTDPLRLLLAGAGLSVLLGSATGLIILNAPSSLFDSFRLWAAGSIDGRDIDSIAVLFPFLAVGVLSAILISGSLNALALGPETGEALGVRPAVVWGVCCIAIVLLTGSATAAVGPIAFVGLVAPHIARAICGPDHRWIVIFSPLLASILLLVSDILGRIIARPEEIAAGIIVTLLGGPVFLLIVRRFQVSKL